MGEALHNLGIDFGLLLAQAVNFIILLLIFQRFLYKPILKILEERSKKVEESINNAEEIQKRLESTEKESAKIISDTQKQAEKILHETKITGDKLKQDLRAEAEAKASEILDQAKSQIEKDKNQILSEIRDEVATLVERSLLAISENNETKVDKDSIKKTLDKIKG